MERELTETERVAVMIAQHITRPGCPPDVARYGVMVLDALQHGDHTNPRLTWQPHDFHPRAQGEMPRLRIPHSDGPDDRALLLCTECKGRGGPSNLTLFNNPNGRDGAPCPVCDGRGYTRAISIEAKKEHMNPNIPTPKEMLAASRDFVKGYVDQLAIRLRMTKDYGGRFVVVEKHGVPVGLQTAVAREFESCGWAVNWTDGQLEGEFVTFTARPSTSPTRA